MRIRGRAATAILFGAAQLAAAIGWALLPSNPPRSPAPDDAPAATATPSPAAAGGLATAPPGPTGGREASTSPAGRPQTRLVLVKGIVRLGNGGSVDDAESVVVDVVPRGSEVSATALRCDAHGYFSGWIPVPQGDTAISCLAHQESTGRTSPPHAVALPAGVDRVALVLPIGFAARMTARVVDAAGAPAPRAVVRVTETQSGGFLGPPESVRRAVRADVDGRVQAGVVAGTVALRATLPDGTLGAVVSKECSVGTETNFGTLVVPTPGRPLRVRFVDPEGRPVPDAVVQVEDAALVPESLVDATPVGVRTRSTLRSDAEGRVAIERVAPEVLPVKVEVASTRFRRRKIELSGAGEVVVTLTPRPSFDVIVAPAQPGLAALLEGAVWIIEDDAPRFGDEGPLEYEPAVLPTDAARGRFTGYADAEGSHLVGLHLAGEGIEVIGTVTVSADATSVLELRLPPMKRIRLKCPIDAPLRSGLSFGEQVTVLWSPWPDAPRPRPTNLTDLTEAGVDVCVPASVDHVAVKPRGGIAHFLEAGRDVASTETEVVLPLTIRPDLESVSLRLTGGGEPLEASDFPVNVVSASGDAAAGVFTDAAGTARLALPAGTYIAWCEYHLGGGDQRRAFTVPRGTSAPFDVPVWR